MSLPAVYYSRLDGRIQRARALEAYLGDGAHTPEELGRMEVRRTGTEEWVPLVSLLSLNGEQLPDVPMGMER